MRRKRRPDAALGALTSGPRIVRPLALARRPAADRLDDPTAFVGTPAARGRAALAMLMLVTRALGRARRADLPAEPTRLVHELAAAGHEARGHAAQRRAVQIGPDARGHHPDVVLAQARACA